MRNERSVARLIHTLRYLDSRLRSARASPLSDYHLGTSFGQRLIIRVLLQYMRGKQIEIKARPVIRIVE